MNRTTDAPGARKHPSTYSAADLHRILVEDAVLNHATELRWFTAAIARITQLTRKSAEQAYLDVLDEVETLTGDRRMPMASGPV